MEGIEFYFLVAFVICCFVIFLSLLFFWGAALHGLWDQSALDHRLNLGPGSASPEY